MTTLLCDLPEIPGYAVEMALGAGGMATVYRARQVALDRPVAIKVLRAIGRDSEELDQRFEQEAKMIAALDHPNIVAIYEVTRTTSGDACYVMPLLGDGDLASWPTPLIEAEIKRVVKPVLDALGHAHARGVVHRDVKAENVLFDARGTPLLADFGVALQIEKLDRLTALGRTVGSSQTMSPEQARGEVVDGRSDLYSVGCLVYELLTGRHAFPGEDFLAVALKHQQEAIPRLPADCAHWQAFIDRALAKKPAMRFPDAAAMAQALEAIERKPARALPVARRWPLLAALALLALSALAWALLRTPAPVEDSGVAPARDVAVVTSVPADALAPVANALAAGRLFDGSPDSADALLQPAFASEPVDARALDLRDELLARFEPTLLAATPEGLAVLLPRWSAFVHATQADGTPPVREAVAELEKRLQPELAKARGSRDRAQAGAALVLAQALPSPSKAFADLTAEVGKLPASGEAFRDGQGPELLLIPGGRLPGFKAPFAVTNGEITRAEYARFAQATGRSAANCRDGGKARSWQSPGFGQDPSEPAICVSFADATAYAAWLSRQSAHTYRLPTLDEWRALAEVARSPCANLAGESPECGDRYRQTAPIARFAAPSGLPHDLAGNVREWTSSCEIEKIGAVSRTLGNLGRWITRKEKDTRTTKCVGRFVAGSGWRDRGGMPVVSAAEGSAAVDRGFRLIREVR